MAARNRTWRAGRGAVRLHLLSIFSLAVAFICLASALLMVTNIAAVRDRSHWNTQNIRPRNPVALGLCTQADLDAAATKAGATLPSLGVRYMTAEEAKEWGIIEID